MQLAGMPLRDQQPSKAQIQDMKMKECSKFQRSKSNQDINSSRAIIFNCLRKDGCDKETALTFCTKNICKFDSTKMTDGPKNFRILNVKYEKQKVLNGWYQQQPHYIMNKKYNLSVNDFLHQEDEETQKFQNEFETQQNKTQQEYKDKIQNIQKYYKDLNQRYSLQAENYEELKTKIKDFRSQLNKNQQQCYVAHGNMKLYGLGEQMKQKKENKNNLIQQAQAFNYFGVNLDKIMNDKDYNFIDSRHADEMFQQKLTKEYESNQQKQPNLKVNKPRKTLHQQQHQYNIKQQQFVNQKFLNLLSKSKILSNLVKLEDYSDDQKASLIGKQLKKRVCSQARKLEGEQINQLLRDKEQTALLEKEFNSSKYVTQKKKKLQSYDFGSMKLLDTQLKQFIQDQIKNLHSDQENQINQQRLKDMVEMRSSYERSHSRRISELPDLKISKTGSYMNMTGFRRQQSMTKLGLQTKSKSEYLPLKSMFSGFARNGTNAFDVNVNFNRDSQIQSQQQQPEQEEILGNIRLKDYDD